MSQATPTPLYCLKCMCEQPCHFGNEKNENGKHTVDIFCNSEHHHVSQMIMTSDGWRINLEFYKK